MGISRVSSRLAATTAATALVVGAFSAMAPAGAATHHRAASGPVYTCTVPVLGPVDIPMSFSFDQIPSLPTEAPLDALPVNVTSELPESLLGPLKLFFGLTDLGGTLAPFTMDLDGVPLAVSGATSPLTAIPVAGSMLVGAVGTASADPLAKAGAPGEYTLGVPSHLDFLPLSSLPLPIPLPELGLPCELKEGSAAPTVTVRKQTASLAAVAAKKTIKKGTAAKVATSVTRELGGKGAGNVQVLDNGKMIANKSLNNGNARFTLKNLKVGKHTLKFKYLGNAKTAGATKKVIIKVVK